MQFDRDPEGFGVNTTPDPPLQRTSSNASEVSTTSLAGTSTTASRSSHSMSDSDSCASSYSTARPRRRHRRQARKDAGPLGTIKVAAFTLCAAGLVAAVAQRSGVLPQASAKSDQQQHHRRPNRKYQRHTSYAVPRNHAESLHTVQEEEEA